MADSHQKFPVSVRRASATDKEAIVDWYRDTISTILFGKSHSHSSAELTAILKKTFEDKNQTLLIGSFDNVRIGAVLLQQTSPKRYQAFAYIRPPYGRKKMLARLVHSAAQFVWSELAAESITIKSAIPGNVLRRIFSAADGLGDACQLQFIDENTQNGSLVMTRGIPA